MDTVVSRNPLERVWCLFWVLHFIFPLALPTPTMSSLMIDATFYRFVCNRKQFVKVFLSHTPPKKPLAK